MLGFCLRPHYFSCYTHSFLLFYDSSPIFLNTAYFSSFELPLPLCSHLLNPNICSYSLVTFPPVGILLTSQTRYLGALLLSSHLIPHSIFSLTLCWYWYSIIFINWSDLCPYLWQVFSQFNHYPHLPSLMNFSFVFLSSILVKRSFP